MDFINKFKMKESKKAYKTPTMNVVQLQQRYHLLAGSAQGNEDYDKQGYYEE